MSVFSIRKVLKLSKYASVRSRNQPYLCTMHSESDADPISSTETVSFLIISCGLSPQTAIDASRSLNLKTLDKPESVVTLFTKYGFSKTQIANLVTKRPRFLLADPQKTIDPKLQFLKSIGASNDDIGRLVSRDVAILGRSLENQLIPNYNFIKSILKSDAKVVAALRRTTWILFSEWSKYLGPNIDILRKFGVRESSIMFLLVQHPQALFKKTEKLREVVMEVLELGFDPMKLTFVIATHVLIWKGSKIAMARCFELYKKWGWSDDEIRSAFKIQPPCMLMSEAKITKTMEFLVNKMGWQSSVIARYPSVLFFSLDKRIIPRCSVIQVLLTKGVVKFENLNLSSILVPPEPLFLKRLVTKYENQVPNLLDFYQGKLKLSQL